MNATKMPSKEAVGGLYYMSLRRYSGATYKVVGAACFVRVGLGMLDRRMCQWVRVYQGEILILMVTASIHVNEETRLGRRGCPIRFTFSVRGGRVVEIDTTYTDPE
jgi:hypothetical protein